MKRILFSMALLLLHVLCHGQIDHFHDHLFSDSSDIKRSSVKSKEKKAANSPLPLIISNEDIVDKIVNNFDSIADHHAHTQLFLHMDKTIYDHGENIWLAGYVIRSPYALPEHHTMYVTLSDKHTKKVISSNSFIMVNGKGAGYVFLHDSLPAGIYTLIAYTNTKGNEKHGYPFVQDVTIRPFKELYTLSFKAVKESSNKDSVIIYSQLKDQNNKFPIGQEVTYTLKSGNKTIASGSSYININGEPELPAFPVNAFSNNKAELTIEVKKDKVPFTTTITVTLPEKIAFVKWFPESGKLISGFPSAMAFEARDAEGAGLLLKGSLMEDGAFLTNIQTKNTGAGVVKFTPYSNKKYTIQWENTIYKIDDTLPLVANDGYTLNINTAVIKDSVQLWVHTTTPGTAYLMIHDYRDMQELLKLSLKTNRTFIKLDAKKWNDGLSTLTLFDSHGNPVAERAVFKEPATKFNVTIKTDSAIYNNRSKVDVTIKLLDKLGNPVQASLSLTCILKNRIDSSRYQNILPYVYYNRITGFNDNSLPSLYRMAGNTETEMLLLTRYWTNYKWNDMLNDKYQHPPHKQLNITGIVKHKNRQLKKPVEIVLMNGTNISSIKTDSSGFFQLLPEMLLSEPESKINLIVNEKIKEDYTVSLYNTNDLLEQYFSTISYPGFINIAQLEKPMVQADELLTSVKTLAGVTVQSKNYNSDVYKSKYCNDYVCMNNILNCRNHRSGGTRPQHGATYSMQDVHNGMMVQVVYKACDQQLNIENKIIHQLKGRYFTKEFYVADYAKHNPAEPEKFSTLYWNPDITTNALGEATISFYTNDLEGVFSCIIQGVSNAGAVSSKTEFSVRGK